MESEIFRSGEYHKLVSGWWAQYHGNPINPSLLARFGVAVISAGKPLAITHLYPTSTADIVWLGFTIVDPKVSRYQAGKAMILLLQEAEEATRRLGYSVLYTAFDAPALQKLCKRNGYHEGSHVIEQWKKVTL